MSFQSEQQFLINNLREAVEYFRKGDSRPLYDAGVIKPTYENLGRKYFIREHDIGDKDNDFNVLIQKQSDAKRFGSPVAHILRYDIKANALGIMDAHYYIIIYRRKWLGNWGRNLGDAGEGPGVAVPGRILQYVENNKMDHQSDLVLVLGDGSIHQAGLAGLRRFYDKKLKIPLYVSQWGQLMTGFPKELFELWI